MLRTTLVFICTLLASSAWGQLPDRFALILEDPPVSARFASREETRSSAGRTYQNQVQARQRLVRTELTARHIAIVGAVDTVLNAVFVAPAKDQIAALSAIPGVKGVVRLGWKKRTMNQAVQLVNAPTAWNALGGLQNAGAGIKIAILDTGIEHTHPAFRDPSLPVPAGFPICSGADCAYTNNKVIVARSYVKLSPLDPPETSRPDDYSPRDHSGHGTAVASVAAAVQGSGGAIQFSGMAPKAYLGNYKIYGSPEVTDFASDAAIMMALEDAYKDGMDIVSFSTGSAALSGPLDAGGTCSNDAGVPCDAVAFAFEKFASLGLVIVVSAGNDGDKGLASPPAFNTIQSPASAPSVISVGATTNSHVFTPGVTVSGPGVPSNLLSISAQLGDGPPPSGAITAPFIDAAQAGNDGFACTALAFGSLLGKIALIERSPAGGCDLATKVSNALNAGATAVILYADSSSSSRVTGLSTLNIPVVMVSNSDGVALKNYFASNPGRTVTIDPNLIEQSTTPNIQAIFSSTGPTAGDGVIKPELVAPGVSIYMAAETTDPLGDLYSSTGYAAADGTSFSTPIVAGAAALVKQKHPQFTAAQIKSVLVNTAAQDVVRDENFHRATVQTLGAGKLDAGAAVNDVVTVVPSTLSLGVLTSGTVNRTQQLRVTNTGASALSLNVAVSVSRASTGAAVGVDKQNLSLGPGESGMLTVTLSGDTPAPGPYYGAVTIQGPGVSLRVPYLYLTGNGSPADLISLVSYFDFPEDPADGTAGQPLALPIIIKVVDQYGVAVKDAPIKFEALDGGSIQNADSTTDVNGIARAQPVLGPKLGTQRFRVTSGNASGILYAFARPQPTIAANGIVNSGSAAAGSPVAPGSYVAIFGTGLADHTRSSPSATLPLAIDLATVSFDVPSAGISVPGHLVYVSPGQVNVQVPWELQGQSSAQVKISIHYSNGTVVTLPLADYAPAFFEGSPGSVAALDVNGRVITASSPIKRGDVVELFANGLGPVTNQPASGDPAPGPPSLAETKSRPVVAIGGQDATVLFSGLAPGFAGLYQVNVIVPPGIGAGNQPVTLSIGGKTAKASGIQVQ